LVYKGGNIINNYLIKNIVFFDQIFFDNGINEIYSNYIIKRSDMDFAILYNGETNYENIDKLTNTVFEYFWDKNTIKKVCDMIESKMIWRHYKKYTNESFLPVSDYYNQLIRQKYLKDICETIKKIVPEFKNEFIEVCCIVTLNNIIYLNHKIKMPTKYKKINSSLKTQNGKNCFEFLIENQYVEFDKKNFLNIKTKNISITSDIGKKKWDEFNL